MFDSTLSLVQKIIKLQEAIEDATRRKIHFADLQGQLLKLHLQYNALTFVSRHYYKLDDQLRTQGLNKSCIKDSLHQCARLVKAFETKLLDDMNKGTHNDAP